MKPGVRAALARLALVAASTAASLGLAEGVFRAVQAQRPAPQDDRAWRDRIRHMNETIYRRSDDPALVYEPVPGASVEMPYGTAGFNRAAMRDDREHTEAPDGRLRVAMLGDSIVWGEEVALGDTLPRAVERALGGRAEVLNFGVTGYDTAQEAVWYGRAVRRFRPAVVVLVYCLNDAMLMSGPYNRFATPEESARKDAQDALWDRLRPVRAETLESVGERETRSARWRTLAAARGWLRAQTYARRADYTDEYLLSHAQTDRRERVRGALAALGAELRRDGVRGVLVISPVLRAWEAYPWRGIHREVGQWARAAGFAVIDPIERWRGAERAESLRLPGDALHYGPAGNARLGRVIAAALPP